MKGSLRCTKRSARTTRPEASKKPAALEKTMKWMRLILNLVGADVGAGVVGTGVGALDTVGEGVGPVGAGVVGMGVGAGEGIGDGS